MLLIFAVWAQKMRTALVIDAGEYGSGSVGKTLCGLSTELVFLTSQRERARCIIYIIYIH